MSRSVYEEAIADAKKVREVAEENAKKAILESVTPRIREFIEEQLLEDGLTFSKEEQEAEEAAMSSQYGDPAIQDVPESVKLDESAIIALVELLGGDEAINSLKEASTKDAMNIAVQAALGRLSDKERQKLFEIADKIERNANNLTSNDINKDIRLKEKDNMSKDKFYEVDLKMLREAVLNEEWGSKSGEDPRRDGHRISGNADYTGDWLEEDDEMSDDDLKEIMASLNEQGDDISALFADVDVEEEGDEMDVEVEDEMDVEVEDEMDVEVEGDDEDLPEDIEDILDNLEDAIMSAINTPRDIEVDIEQVDVEEEDEEVEVDDDVEVDEEEVAMNEVFEIDPRVLRRELSRMRRQIREGKVDHHFGGKGDAKAGVNNSYGGKGAKKLGWQKSFGGGTPGKDPFENPPNINVLKEMRAKMRDATRKNRSMQEKLNKYRSAVQTLREQLEDLNLFNAKLLYVNKLLQNKGLQEGQKKSIIRALDQAQTLKETKMLYKSLTESFMQDKKSTLSESRTRGSSSRATTSSSSKQMNEVNRWATLAGLK
jgi:hypothetical protein